MSLVCVSVVVAFFIEGIWSHAENSQCGKVHLTVSSIDSCLEMNWITNCTEGEDIPEYIVFSSKTVRDNGEDYGIIEMLKYSDFPSGYFKTKVKFEEPQLPGGWDYNNQNVKVDSGLHCFPYWISSVNKNYSIDSRCLGIQPTWMSDNRQHLGNQKIASLLIPGTHNAGSFTGLSSSLEKHFLNQDRNIWTQLVFGIRYLDFRIGYYEKEGFYINHDRIKVTKVVPLFQELKKFLQLAPNEIVILDFHRFPVPSNFTLDLHRKFIDLVDEELGMFAVPSTDTRGGKGPTLNEIWAQNKNLIICYADSVAVQDIDWLWNPLTQYWANTKSDSYLKQYMKNSITEHQQASTTNPLRALMAEFTPQMIDYVFGTNSLRKLAQNVNGLVTKWFRDELGAISNIVATDFFLGNDMINVAIEINTKRPKSRSNKDLQFRGPYLLKQLWALSSDVARN